MTSFIYLFKMINIVTWDPDIFLWIATSFADADAVNFNGIKRLSAKAWSKFHIKDKSGFSND